ncbi:MAG TPA: hypothetical protein DCS29_01775 [Candidatus Magasanikbacteria bacterium]|nr:MAG: hypothetical protein A2479_01345 [Candidatus Magasanikbacteria bacterium RIFOXYC2_FULL_39_8]HAT03486.1 hypothetical protein [Candidatus Magasanikbacteria bacterium]
MLQTKKRIVVMGGGNGSAVTLNAVKQLTDTCDISAVISMLDSGYSTGAIRKFFDMLPPGDILRAILAMSPYNFQILKKIFYKNRISTLKKLNGDLNASRGPSLGNVFIALTTQYEGDFVRAIRSLEEVLETVGHAYPSTLKQADLIVELSNGDIIRGETHIDEPTYDRNLRIKKAYVEPYVEAYPDALDQIKQASCIVFGPGDLYTSIVASLLPQGIQEAIKQSPAKLVYVVGNAYHTHGETGPTTLSEFISELELYLPRPLDYILFNNAQLNKNQLALYARREWSLIEQDITPDIDKRIIAGDYERSSGGLCSDKLARMFKKLSTKCN